MVSVRRERRGCGEDLERLVMLMMMIKRGGDLSGEVLCGYDLSGLRFESVVMRGARFDGMSLGHSSFEYVDLEGASFRGCDLSVRYELDSISDSKGDFFYGGEFYSEGTSMRGALLSGVDWEGANVEGVIYN
jgi:uncharacterized protein YjbI with pentapeptide repeats